MPTAMPTDSAFYLVLTPPSGLSKGWAKTAKSRALSQGTACWHPYPAGERLTIPAASVEFAFLRFGGDGFCAWLPGR